MSELPEAQPVNYRLKESALTPISHRPPRRHRRRWPAASLWAVLILWLGVSGCTTIGRSIQEGPSARTPLTFTSPSDLTPMSKPGEQPLKVVATTNLIADVTSQVAGERAQVISLLPKGADPHGYQLSPGDLRLLEEADVVFLNGLGLESSILGALAVHPRGVPWVALSEGLELESHLEPEEEDHEHLEDPHVWFDPENVAFWVGRIARALSNLDPGGSQEYQARAQDYQQELRELDVWIRGQVERVPDEDRRLVTDHQALEYFARRYGFESIGTVVPGYSTGAEPSARSLAGLETTLRQTGVAVIFVGVNVNQDLPRSIASDLGAELVPLYTGSLSEPDGPASTYLQFMRYNVAAIVAALGSR